MTPEKECFSFIIFRALPNLQDKKLQCKVFVIIAIFIRVGFFFKKNIAYMMLMDILV